MSHATFLDEETFRQSVRALKKGSHFAVSEKSKSQ
jgi:hypothetical protein